MADPYRNYVGGLNPSQFADSSKNRDAIENILTELESAYLKKTSTKHCAGEVIIFLENLQHDLLGEPTMLELQFAGLLHVFLENPNNFDILDQAIDFGNVLLKE